MYVESAMLPVLDGFGAMSSDYMMRSSANATDKVSKAKLSSPTLPVTCPSCSPIVDVVCPDCVPCPSVDESLVAGREAAEKADALYHRVKRVEWWWLFVAGFGGFAAGAGIASVMRKKA